MVTRALARRQVRQRVCVCLCLCVLYSYLRTPRCYGTGPRALGVPSSATAARAWGHPLRHVALSLGKV